MTIPENVKQILKTLNSNGYQAYIVGGAVRDYMRDIEPHDWDITTNAKPEEIKKCFNRTIDTGIKHGTVTAMLNGEGYEITTYRVDGDYSDGRHPDSVEFVDDIKEDLARRDLTINAMAMDINCYLVDPFKGLWDLRQGIIRCVGDPIERFNEDALRMLRAVRFEAKFGFRLDENTRKAITLNAKDITKVSAERIREEYTKILMSDNPKLGIQEAYNTGLTKYTIPEIDVIMECEQNNPYHYGSVGIHTLDVIQNLPKDMNLRWAGLLHDMGKPIVKTINPKTGNDIFRDHQIESKKIADDILIRLKFSNKDREEIVNLVEQHDTVLSRDIKIRQFSATFGKDFINKLYQLQVADAKGHKAEYVDSLIAEKKKWIDKAIKSIDDRSAITISDLQINGNELIQLGLKGVEIGDFLRDALQACLGQPELNNSESLLNMANKRVAKLHPELLETEPGVEYAM